ncbi:type II and III secretion system protein family protein [Phenylobacterium soli]|nr:type II and III secretion system protein family protein [Phenylobacterium soli]
MSSGLVVLGALIAATPPSGARAQTVDGSAVSAAQAPVSELIVPAGKSRVLQIPETYTDVMVADPKIADVLPLNAHSVYVVGKTAGSTALSLYGPGKRLISATNVVVSADVDGLKARLADLLPRERDISVRPANQSLVLSGVVSSPAALSQALALAETYAPTKVVNMLGVEGTQQVMLSVRFVEMQRSVAKNLRLNVNRSLSGGNPQVSVFTGDTLVRNGGALIDSFGSVSLLFNHNLEILLDALEDKGVVRTLAEPNLMAMSGDTANFLAGGEFPIPVAQNNAAGSTPTITIEFKQFGVGLAFTPTILRDGMINISVDPEVSSIDPTVSVDLGLIKVPGIKVRRAHTTVELREGESFTIAGLLKDDYRSEIRQYPFIGDVPVLGALFRSNGFTHDQTELVIVVTPHLVTARRAVAALPSDRFTPPSDLERFLFGWQEGVGRNLKPEDRALLSADPSKGGVDGPHGHVLY